MTKNDCSFVNRLSKSFEKKNNYGIKSLDSCFLLNVDTSDEYRTFLQLLDSERWVIDRSGRQTWEMKVKSRAN